MNENQELRSLKRGLKVLSLLNRTEYVSISELARHLDLPRTTAERIMLTLVAEGYVQRVPDDKRYRLSAKVCSLSGGFSKDSLSQQYASSDMPGTLELGGEQLAMLTAHDDRAPAPRGSTDLIGYTTG